jgi:hypothetical protein
MANGTRINPAEKALARKKSQAVEFHPSEETTAFEAARKQGGGIAVGAHKELEDREPGLKMPAWMKSIGATIMGKKTPGRPATPHPAPTKEMTPAEADSIYKKYVERK